MFISQYGHSLSVLQLTIIIIKPTLNQVYPRKRGWPDLPLQQSLILHLTQFMASFFSKPMLLRFNVILSSTSSLVILASSYPSLQTPTLFSECAHHPSSAHTHTISLHSPLPSEPLFPSILTSPSGPLFSFSPSDQHHTLTKAQKIINLYVYSWKLRIIMWPVLQLSFFENKEQGFFFCFAV